MHIRIGCYKIKVKVRKQCIQNAEKGALKTLYVTTGEFEPFDGDIDNVFYGNFEEEWFSMDFVKQEDACAIFEDTGTAVQNRHEFMLELIYDLDRTRRR